MARGKKTGGRVAGTPNKTTASMKAAIQSVYDKLQEASGGDHGHFLAWAQGEPTEFYKLASKLLPIQVAGDEENPIRHVMRVELVDLKSGDGADRTTA
ncbi:hypothetical protein [Sphingomonas sp. MA1305]|uniref:hypothetical protein n=1 Tax=Sphingomonas sp. MA1305 TaxID=2479204 RepID=UPI0018E04DDE|nr:hypothetical protein [Sphingomonas sp. MA1305]